MANIHISGWHRVVISQKLKVFGTKRYICKATKVQNPYRIRLTQISRNSYILFNKKKSIAGFYLKDPEIDRNKFIKAVNNMVKNQAVIGENAAMCALDSVLSSILGNLLNASWAKWWHTTRVLLCIWSTEQLTESSWVKIPIWISSLDSLVQNKNKSRCQIDHPKDTYLKVSVQPERWPNIFNHKNTYFQTKFRQHLVDLTI